LEPDSGPYSGTVVFQSGDNTMAIAASGKAVVSLGGVVHTPAATVNMAGGHFELAWAGARTTFPLRNAETPPKR
jgi:hypothetical protein